VGTSESNKRHTEPRAVLSSWALINGVRTWLGGDMGGPCGPELGPAFARAPAALPDGPGGALAIAAPPAGNDRLPVPSVAAMGADGRAGAPALVWLTVG